MTAPGGARRLTLLVLCASVAAACGENKAESKQAPRRPPVTVAVAPVEQKTMPLQIQAIGTVEAHTVVSVRAQVGGELRRVHIKEGQDVKKGDLLFTIDPRPLEASLAQAQAALARDQVLVQQARAVIDRDQARVSQAKAALARDEAQLKNAEVQVRRYGDLLKRELIAQEQYDQLKTTAEALAATVRADEADVKSAEETVRADQAAVRSAEQSVRADEAAVDSAKIQLGYATIRAPIDGRTGTVLLTEGNIVRAVGTNDTPMLVINGVRPIYVSFTVPQQQLPTINRYLAAGKLSVAALPAGDPKPVIGVVTFVDNTVDAATGTIKLKATFTNDEGRLWPGQFANVTLTLASEADAIVIPSQAVQSGQQGAFVFVVKADGAADQRPVTVARTQGGETVIAKGLLKGESVVTDGQARLTAGAKVEVRAAGKKGGEGGRKGGEGKGGEGKAADGKAGDGKAGDGKAGEAAKGGEGGPRGPRGAKGGDGAPGGGDPAKKTDEAAPKSESPAKDREAKGEGGRKRERPPQ
jgi:multidrug efflux system membrane fusion protein